MFHAPPDRHWWSLWLTVKPLKETSENTSTFYGWLYLPAPPPPPHTDTNRGSRGRLERSVAPRLVAIICSDRGGALFEIDLIYSRSISHYKHLKRRSPLASLLSREKECLFDVARVSLNR